MFGGLWYLEPLPPTASAFQALELLFHHLQTGLRPEDVKRIPRIVRDTTTVYRCIQEGELTRLYQCGISLTSVRKEQLAVERSWQVKLAPLDPAQYLGSYLPARPFQASFMRRFRSGQQLWFTPWFHANSITSQSKNTEKMDIRCSCDPLRLELSAAVCMDDFYCLNSQASSASARSFYCLQPVVILQDT